MQLTQMVLRCVTAPAKVAAKLPAIRHVARPLGIRPRLPHLRIPVRKMAVHAKAAAGTVCRYVPVAAGLAATSVPSAPVPFTDGPGYSQSAPEAAAALAPSGRTYQSDYAGYSANGLGGWGLAAPGRQAAETLGASSSGTAPPSPGPSISTPPDQFANRPWPFIPPLPALQIAPPPVITTPETSQPPADAFAVPEPSEIGLAMGAMTLLLLRFRHRK
jgi:hypothetical protein